MRFRRRRRARRYAGRADRARPAAVAHRRSTRASAAAASRRRATSRRSAFDALPVDADRSDRCSCYPTAGTRDERGVPARGRPAQRDRRVAGALRHPRRGRAGRRRRRADRRRAAAGGVGVAARRPTPPTSPDGRHNPTDARRPRSSTAGSGARPRSSRRTPTCPLTLAPSPETLEAWDALVGKQSPELAAGAAIRSAAAVGPQPGAHRTVRAPRPAVDPRAAASAASVEPASSRAASPRSRRSSAPTSTPSTALPGPLDAVALRHARRSPVRRQLVRRRRRSSRPSTRSTRPRTRTRCRRTRATTPARSRCSRPTPVSQQFLTRRRATRAARRAPARRARARRR